MNSLQLISKLYNTREIERSTVLSQLNKPKKLFNLTIPVEMDDLSYVRDINNRQIDYKLSKEMFKQKFTCSVVENKDKLIFSFYYKDVLYTNQAVCFKSNI